MSEAAAFFDGTVQLGKRENVLEIRLAAEADAESIREIYAPYVLRTAVSFEYEVPDVEEMRSRIRNTLKEYPWLVATEEDRIVGYCYAGQFHSREAYRHAVELSVYVRQDCRQNGIGSGLYGAMEGILLKQNIFSVHACIAVSEEEEEYLTDDSRRFHERMGFQTAGRHERCGYKFGRWYSIIWMDKLLRERPETPEAFVPFERLREEPSGR